MKTQYIFLDAEFGGLEKDKYSLLSVYLMATDESFKRMDELSLFLKPDDGIYKVCASAMKVNKINLVEHDKIAITYKEGSTKLYNWLKQLTDDGKEKLIVVGHGVYGDVEWIIHHLISLGSWDKFVSYRKLDTQAVMRFLIACNIISDEVSGSLVSIGKFFGIDVKESDAHNAEYDTHLTWKVFLALREYLKNRCAITEVEARRVRQLKLLEGL
jgi:DNA polymerase III alpha subunit (gram-positive type)